MEQIPHSRLRVAIPIRYVLPVKKQTGKKVIEDFIYRAVWSSTKIPACWKHRKPNDESPEGKKTKKLLGIFLGFQFLYAVQQFDGRSKLESHVRHDHLSR